MQNGNRAKRLASIKLTHFECAGVRYDLRRPLMVRLEHKDGHWVYHNKTLNLWGRGKNKGEALRDFHENFAYLWKEIAEEQDNVLDEKAKTLKRTLVRLRVPAIARSGV